ncbi:hypothetical protein ACJJTC_015914 [Scirpophaga incertulas]
MCKDNSPNQQPVYRKVAIVENFFDIIYTVHVELEGRAGKHAGQKRTYRTITESYAFLPREAVTRFLTGCADCARRPRSITPPQLLTPSPSPTRPTAYHHYLPPCPPEYNRNWELEIDAAQNYYDPKYDHNEYQPQKKMITPMNVDEEARTYIELTSKKPIGYDSSASSLLYHLTSPVDYSYREPPPPLVQNQIDIDNEDTIIDVEVVRLDSPLPLAPQRELVFDYSYRDMLEPNHMRAIENQKRGPENIPRPRKDKKYNPLDVDNLTSKDPPRTKRSPPKKKSSPVPLGYPTPFVITPKASRPDVGALTPRFNALYGEKVDYNVPITTTYLKHMKNLEYRDGITNNKMWKVATSYISTSPSKENTKQYRINIKLKTEKRVGSVVPVRKRVSSLRPPKVPCPPTPHRTATCKIDWGSFSPLPTPLVGYSTLPPFFSGESTEPYSRWKCHI